ncbi:MAG: FHA domain-containing protein, partial [Anaerolineae bacterium]|nr:FHA domain-containing protein [Anaerolineae bacterium]
MSNKGTLFLKHTQLIITFPDGKEEKLPLVKDLTRIGRSASNELAMPAEFKSISRQHLEIRREGMQYIAVDLDSDNGIFVNDEKVTQITLSDQDEIQIGLAEHGHLIQIRFEAGTNLSASPVSPQTEHSPFHLLADAPKEIPYLGIRFPKGNTDFFSIEKETIIVGRSSDADLSFPDGYGFISSEHFKLESIDNAFTITDLNSTNGTLLNNHKLPPGVPIELHDNAIIRLGDDSFGISLGITFHNHLEAILHVDGFAIAAPSIVMGEETVISIGRFPENDVVLDAPDVSRQHATLMKREQVYVLSDLGSRNGTFVNEQLIQFTELHEGDIIRIGTFLLTFQNGEVTPYQSNGMRMDVSNLSKDVKTRKGKLRILDDISLSVLPREFIAIVGGSGAGKTTLLNALVGIRPGDGDVQLNGQDFYKEYEHFRAQLGYVPQNDILHTTLTVEKALDYTAKLRLPASVKAEERERRITSVLETVSMNTET